MLPIAANVRSICFTQDIKSSSGEVVSEGGANNSAVSVSVPFVTSQRARLHDYTPIFLFLFLFYKVKNIVLLNETG